MATGVMIRYAAGMATERPTVIASLAAELGFLLEEWGLAGPEARQGLEHPTYRLSQLDPLDLVETLILVTSVVARPGGFPYFRARAHMVREALETEVLGRLEAANPEGRF